MGRMIRDDVETRSELTLMRRDIFCLMWCVSLAESQVGLNGDCQIADSGSELPAFVG